MKPDKGTGIVILDRADYISKMDEITSDTTKFKLAKSQNIYGISRSIERRVRDYLLNHIRNLAISLKNSMPNCIQMAVILVICTAYLRYIKLAIQLDLSVQRLEQPHII